MLLLRGPHESGGPDGHLEAAVHGSDLGTGDGARRSYTSISGMTSPDHDWGLMRLSRPQGSQNREFATRKVWVSLPCHVAFIGPSSGDWPHRLVPTTGRTRVGGLEACGVPQLGIEEGGIVVGDEGVAQRYSGDDRGHDTTIGAREMGEEPVTHDRHDPGHLMDDVLGLDIDDASERVGVLELHDEAQHGLEPVVSFEPGDSLGDPGVVALLLVEAEGLEEVLLG